MATLKDIATLKTALEWSEIRFGCEKGRAGKSGDATERKMSHRAEKIALDLVKVGVNGKQAVELGIKFSRGGFRKFRVVNGNYCPSYTGEYLLCIEGVKFVGAVEDTSWSNHDREMTFRMMSGSRTRKHGQRGGVGLSELNALYPSSSSSEHRAWRRGEKNHYRSANRKALEADMKRENAESCIKAGMRGVIYRSNPCAVRL